jgi:hypothetical protein
MLAMRRVLLAARVLASSVVPRQATTRAQPAGDEANQLLVDRIAMADAIIVAEYLEYLDINPPKVPSE